MQGKVLEAGLQTKGTALAISELETLPHRDH